jgi:LPS export ABC transporter permease LptG/LPS export ABC transporter permease LptF
MPKIDKLLYHAIIPPFLIALVVLTFVVAVHELGTLSELLITREVSIGVILTSIGAILPGILIFSLPLSYLIGILIGLTGLSGESQITALRACGVPLHALLRSILVLGFVVGSVTAVLSLVILPRTNDVLRGVKDQISLTTLAASQIKPRVFNEDFPNVVFYLDDLATDRQHWSRVFLADNSDPKSPRIVIARSGTWITGSSSLRPQLHLEQGASYSVNPEDPSKDNVSLFASTDIPIDTSRNSDSTAAANARSRKVTEQSSGYLWRNYRKAPAAEQLEQLVELNRRIALPFSIFPFALLGLTLAVGAPKGGRTNGFALSLVTVVVFYILFFNGLRLASVGKISPWLGAWSADILLVAAGLLLLRKVELSFALNQWVSALLWKAGWGALDRRFRRDKDASPPPHTINAMPSSTGSYARFRFPRVLDLYISRGFLVFFFWSLMTCGTLFILFTLFDLLDDIIRNRISISYVIAYFTFLTPQILMIVIPMSVLLAILINFGILEKNSEITAIKAGGWSLYRIAIPVFLIASGLCIGLFLMQDYVLPYANDRQDGLRNLIKGRPYQTSTRLQRKWIFGESGRIYNYEYFDGNLDSFVDLNVYEVDLNAASILRRTHAARARITPDNEWRLEDGWIRDYQARQSGFKRIQLETVRFPEKAGYFEKEIFQPKESSKLTYVELKSYIGYLMKSGYNATELQVELNKKISFPLSCVVMALLGVPFSFSTGKKGAFFGIGLSIAIGIAYWGIAGVFEAMGAHGLLVPVLAAWAPIIIFGASGLALLLTIRT